MFSSQKNKLILSVAGLIFALSFSSDAFAVTIKNSCWKTLGYNDTQIHLYNPFRPPSCPDAWVGVAENGQTEWKYPDGCPAIWVEPHGTIKSQTAVRTNATVVQCSMNGLICQCAKVSGD